MSRLFYVVFGVLSSMPVMVGATTPIEDKVQEIHLVASHEGNDGGFYLQMADGSAYDQDYAQDFARCSQHFFAGRPPVLHENLGQENYPLCFHGFAVMYSGVSRTGLYAAEHLTKSRVVSASQMVREDSFRPEFRLPVDIRAELSDYQGLGFDRGHLAPNGDMADKVSQYDSFSLANIVPQDGTHNRNLWKDIEGQVRALAMEHGELYVVTGVVFVTPEVRHAGKILVPTHLYKAVYVPNIQQSVVYYTKNSANTGLEMIDLVALQARTGVTVFPSVAESQMLAITPPSQANAAKEVGWGWFVRLIGQKIWQIFG